MITRSGRYSFASRASLWPAMSFTWSRFTSTALAFLRISGSYSSSPSSQHSSSVRSPSEKPSSVSISVTNFVLPQPRKPVMMYTGTVVMLCMA